MTDPRKNLLLSWVDAYYPIIYQDEYTKKLKGSSIDFFGLLREYLKDMSYEYTRYDDFREQNRSMLNLGGAMGAIVDGKVLTELSGGVPDESYLQVFDLSPPIGTCSLGFYEADIGSETWSPISYFIPFNPLTFLLVLASVVAMDILQLRSRNLSFASSILTTISSSLFLFGITFILFAYNAGYQGTLIATQPVVKVKYEDMLNAFASRKMQWYFRAVGLMDFSSIPEILFSVEEDMQKLIALMCENPGKVIATLFEVEFLQMQRFDPPKGCQLQKINLDAPIMPSPTYRNFQLSFFYFLLPKNLPVKLRNAINFITNSVFNADQRDGRFLYSSVSARSFVDITPAQRPAAEYSPLSLYSIGVILVIVLSLQVFACFFLALEIVFHRMQLKTRFRRFDLKFRYNF